MKTNCTFTIIKPTSTVNNRFGRPVVEASTSVSYKGMLVTINSQKRIEGVDGVFIASRLYSNVYISDITKDCTVEINNVSYEVAGYIQEEGNRFTTIDLQKRMS